MDECTQALSNFEFDVRLCSTSEDADEMHQCDLREDDMFCWTANVGENCVENFGDEGDKILAPTYFSQSEWESAGFSCSPSGDRCSSDDPKRGENVRGAK